MSDTYARVSAAAHSGAFGINEMQLPTAEQCRAGNYLKGRTVLHGMPIVIEVPQGQRRMGKTDGKPWSTILMAHYGYLAGTKGADSDALDIFVGPVPESHRVWVVNQISQGGAFDEHKILLGYIDEESARAAYMNSYERGWTGLGSLIACSIDQLKWWVKYGNTTIPLTERALPHDGTTDMNEIVWDSAAEPVGCDVADLIYQLRRADGEGLMLDAVTLGDIMEDNDGEEMLDALVVGYAQVERKAEQLRKIMASMGDEVTPVSVQVTPPFKQRGTTNVVMLFELSDGQTISVWMHNPDSTPNRILPQDELVSWSWRLNKKDVSILVAPEKGQDLNPREVARRIMKLAQRNSARFAKANTTRAQRMESIEGLKGTVASKEAALAALDALFSDLTEKVEAKRAAPPKATLQANDQLPEGWTESRPGGMATNRDPLKGGIIDKAIGTNDWFVIFERDGIEQIHDLPSRADAFAAHAAALAAADAASTQQAITFEGRAVAVRAALASLGWDTTAGSTMSHLNIDGSVYGLNSKYTTKGQKVVALTWADTGGGPTWNDDLSMTSEDMAAMIDREFRESVARARAAVLGVTITAVADVMARWNAESLFTNAEAGQIVVAGVAQGWLSRRSTTQVDWTEAGIEALQAQRGSDIVALAHSIVPAEFVPRDDIEGFTGIAADGLGIRIKYGPRNQSVLVYVLDEKGQDSMGSTGIDEESIRTLVGTALAVIAAKRSPVAVPTVPTRLEWEELVYEAIEAEGITRSDAQGIVEAQGTMIDDLYAAGDSPESAATAILGASASDPVPEEDDHLKDAKAFLQSVIDGGVDYYDTELVGKLEAIHDQYADSDEVMELFNLAAHAFSDYMVEQSRAAT